MAAPSSTSHRIGFSLVELSIVLVILGLLVGGILAGQSLIESAAIRSQLAQIATYNVAVNTFRDKYMALPGDIAEPAASNLGLTARGTLAGQGDGNGIIEGNPGSGVIGVEQSLSEATVLFRDLSEKGLIENGFTTARFWFPGYINLTSTPNIYSFLPAAKIGASNFIYTYSLNAKNYWGLSQITNLGASFPSSTAGLRVIQAYNMDKKIDDGMPMSGTTIARFVNNGSYCVNSAHHVSFATGAANSEGANTGWPTCLSTTGATAASATSCYDNGNVSGPMQYSTSQNSGNNINCALSFRFQ